MKKLIADELDLASGRVTIRVLVDEAAYFEVLSDISGLTVRDEYSLFKILKESAEMKEEYEKVRNALAEVRQKGYGIVLPDKTEISLDEPELIRHGSKYGVKIHAQAPSINLIKARIETEIAPDRWERAAGEGLDRVHKGRGSDRRKVSGIRISSESPWNRSLRTACRRRSPR